MKAKIQSLIIISLLISILIIFLVIPSNIMESVSFSISIWKDSLIPSLFPFFLVTELLIQYGFVELIGELSKNIMNSLFHLPGEASFVLIGSLISGFPSSGKYIKELLKDDKIDKKEANYLLKFNHFSNPLFVIGTIGVIFLSNKQIGVLILLVHILSNLIIATIYRPKYNKYKKEKVSITIAINKMHKKRNSDNYSFSEILTNSIFKTINTLLLLLGIITIFIILSAILKEFLDLNPITESILNGILEMTGGIKSISNIDIPINIKASIITFFISFGGLSIHMQVMSILSDFNIKYSPYFISRVLHAIISSSIVYLLLS
ncbi:MAG: hypothetical protein IJO43_02035 [Bacilli bacterium]|nr:hypothetical protein [Bacilli bacterium]